MNPKDFSMEILCFISILLNCSVKGYGSSLKCCFEILRNHSVSYYLTEPPEDFCIPTWSAMDYVVVDEHGNVDETKVVHHETQKLILKGNMDEKDKQVTYRKDCPHTGDAYTAECHDPCVTSDVPRTTPVSETTEATRVKDHGNVYTIGGIIIITIIFVIIIIVICLQRNKWQASNVTFRYRTAVPNNEITVTDATRIGHGCHQNENY